MLAESIIFDNSSIINQAASTSIDQAHIKRSSSQLDKWSTSYVIAMCALKPT